MNRQAFAAYLNDAAFSAQRFTAEAPFAERTTEIEDSILREYERLLGELRRYSAEDLGPNAIVRSEDAEEPHLAGASGE